MADLNAVTLEAELSGIGNNQAKSAEPSLAEQDITPDAGYTGLSGVHVSKVDKELLARLTPTFAAENIKAGITMFGLAGTYEGPERQSKAAQLSTDPQTVTPDEGKVLGSVTIPAAYGENLQDLDPNFVAENIRKDVEVLGVTGAFEPGGGTYQAKTATPSLATQQITPDAGYDALSSVTVNPVTGSLLEDLDGNFAAENIRSGVTMFGKTGTAADGGTVQTAQSHPFTSGYMEIECPKKPLMVYANNDSGSYQRKRCAYALLVNGSYVSYRQTGTTEVSWTDANATWNDETHILRIQVHTATYSGNGAYYVVY